MLIKYLIFCGICLLLVLISALAMIEKMKREDIDLYNYYKNQKRSFVEKSVSWLRIIIFCIIPIFNVCYVFAILVCYEKSYERIKDEYVKSKRD